MNSGSRTANENRVRNRLSANGRRAIRRRCCLRGGAVCRVGCEGGERERLARQRRHVNEHCRPKTSTLESHIFSRLQKEWLQKQRGARPLETIGGH